MKVNISKETISVLVWVCILIGITAPYISLKQEDSRTYSLFPVADGSYYYAYARSLFIDHDIDFQNDYEITKNQFGTPRTKTGRYGNVFTIGPSLFWAPTFALAHGSLLIANKYFGYQDPLDGSTVVYSRIATFGSVIWFLLSLILIQRTLEKFTGYGPSLFASISMVLASPMPWYLIWHPSYSHATSAASTTFFALWWIRTYMKRNRKEWAVLGLLLGLSMLVRSQNALHAVLPLGEWIMLAWNDRKDPRKALRHIQCGVIFTASTTVAFAPQMAAWNLLYGSWLTIPQGSSFMLWTQSEWVRVLFASRNGLVAWHPIFGLSLLGLFLAARRLRREGSRYHAVPWLMLLAIFLQAYASGAAKDWYGGFAFGGRRMMSCIPYLAFGLSFALDSILKHIASPGRIVKSMILASVTTPFFLLNLSMLADFPKHGFQHDYHDPMRVTWQHATSLLIDGLYRTVGNPFILPASLPFAWKFATWPGRYDAVSIHELFVHDYNRSADLDLRSTRLGVRGFSSTKTTVSKRQAVLMEENSGSIAIPLRKPLDLQVTMDVFPSSENQEISIYFAGILVHRSILKRMEWTSIQFPIPRRLTHHGIVRMDIEASHPKRHHPVGKTGVDASLEITVKSQGFSVGNQAIFIQGNETVYHHRRGLVTYRCTVDACRFVTTYDTYRSHAEADRFVRFVERLPRGAIVALAVADEASRRWTDEADRALRSLGAPADFSMKGRWRHSFAFVGVKGAAPGTAMLNVRPRSTAELTVGRSPGLRFEGVAVGRLQLRRR